MWADGNLRAIAQVRNANIGTRITGGELLRSADVKYCLGKKWAGGLHKCIMTLLRSLWGLFMDSKISPGLTLLRTEVNRRQSIRGLEIWLKKFSGNEDEFSNRPFPLAVAVNSDGYSQSRR
ncbi:hypothetical protein PAXINDRAFT_11933 [Paxillus involutus ATCC 200175]|uniref:Uncharacterized protein n=1 Tax=Paxillus involutus ATCC 200175 TaxID=664439 RepID=A0A0C9SZ43_PAXIN|nr:hypothetical protein PAXINDRAFT_11933 [Paxillus involutus ATCC 200175]